MASDDGSRGGPAWLLVAVLGASSVLLGAALYSFSATRTEMEAERRGTTLRLELASLLPALIDAETGQRGYLLTQDTSFLEPYLAGRARLASRLDEVTQELEADGLSVPRDLRALIDQRLARLDQTIEVFRNGEVTAAAAAARLRGGREVMDRVRRRFAELDAQIAADTAAHQRRLARRERISTWIAGASALSILFGLGIGWTLRRELAHQRRTVSQREKILAGLPIGVSLVDARTRKVLYTNRNATRMLGDDPHAVVVQRADGSEIPREDRPTSRALRGELVMGAEVLLTRPGGEPVPTLVNAVPIELDGAAALVALIDQSAQKRVEAQLRTSLGQLDAVLDNAPIGVAFIDVEVRHVRVNRVLTDMMALPVDTLVGRTFLEVMGPAGAELTHLVEQVRDTGQPILDLEVERAAVKAPYELRWWTLNLFPVRTENELLGVGIVVADITKRKHAEAAIDELNQALEDKVAERTDRLTRANQELEAFSYSVSHDLRAPLRAIAGFSRILQEDHTQELGSDAQGLLTRIAEATTRMAHLIDDMLELSRITRAEIRHERVDLSELARSIVGELGDGIPERQVEVRIEPGMVATGDERLLRSALANLLGNAWKFTAKAEAPRIELRTGRREGARAFFVADNGVGFDPKYSHRLFAPFQRLHPQAAFEGTGIGLATVQRVIGKHGGRVWIESAAPGLGVTVGFTLGEAPT